MQGKSSSEYKATGTSKAALHCQMTTSKETFEKEALMIYGTTRQCSTTADTSTKKNWEPTVDPASTAPPVEVDAPHDQSA
jgi:hypothetical protein